MKTGFFTWLLPFGMIAYWMAAGVIELIKTPTAPQNKRERQDSNRERVLS